MLKFVMLASSIVFASSAAVAGPITTAAFTSPTTVSYGNPISGEYQDVAQPLTVQNATFTTSTAGGLRWYSANQPFQDCIGGCVAGKGFSVGSVNLALSSSYALAGLYVGQATAYTLSVSFFDAANVLLGTNVVSGAGDGTFFAGWESDSDKIASISVTNAVNDGFIVSVQSGLFQANAGAVPEPATWLMMIGGFGAVGFAMRRRQQVRPAINFV